MAYEGGGVYVAAGGELVAVGVRFRANQAVTGKDVRAVFVSA